MSAAMAAGLVVAVLTLLLAARGTPERRRGFDAAGPRGRERRVSASGPLGPAGERWLVAVLVVLASAAGGPVVGVVVAIVVVGGRRLLRLVEARRRARRVGRALPDLIDLLRLAAGTGLPVVGALGAVSPRAPPVLAGSLGLAVSQLDHGVELGAVLAELEQELGPAGGPLVAALERSAATGAALAPLLDPVAADGRERRRRRAQEAAHRLPVNLLLPLAGCILPAAIVLAIVPVVAVALGDLTP